MGAFFLECSAQSHQLCSAESPGNGLRFEQLIIHDTKLIPPNKQHEFFSMNIQLDCRCWSMTRSPSFLLLWIIVVNSIFITSDYDAKNSFVYVWQAAFHMWKIGVQRFSASVHMEPNSLAFEPFSMISNDMKLFVESLLI